MKKNEELRVKSEELAACVVRRNSSFRSCKFLTLHSSLLTSPSGFSLVEVMLAIGIVAFAVVGILTAFPVGIDAARDARDETAAALIADDIFTRMRSQPFTRVMVPYQGGFKQIDLTNPPGWISGNRQGDPNMFYYARDGRPANADSGSISDWGKLTFGNKSKADDPYFGAQLCASKQTWADASLNFMPGLARVMVEISWPARTPYNNRKFKRQFDSAICNLH